MRVQIPAYTDRWMMGDRYGDVIKTTKRRFNVTPVLTGNPVSIERAIAHVKLDKSGKTIKVILIDCEVL